MNEKCVNFSFPFRFLKVATPTILHGNNYWFIERRKRSAFRIPCHMFWRKFKLIRVMLLKYFSPFNQHFCMPVCSLSVCLFVCLYFPFYRHVFGIFLHIQYNENRNIIFKKSFGGHLRSTSEIIEVFARERSPLFEIFCFDVWVMQTMLKTF